MAGQREVTEIQGSLQPWRLRAKVNLSAERRPGPPFESSKQEKRLSLTTRRREKKGGG